MKYLAGMVAGSRAKKDGAPKVGYMATFPIPEELRLGNAFALGMKKTCPECRRHGRALDQHLARSGGREGRRGFAV